ncbi:MAG: TraR/DksA C4-type zinc finger protein [Ktedonobacteraceae bacterium]|nr:TraR/DksA C4-type zinc finger protein [Ktedonobacteraceae bacterium]
MALDIALQKARLETKLAEVQAHIREQHAAATRESGEGSGIPDLEEVAADLAARQLEQSELFGEITLSNEIQAALRRIEEGTYGRCIECGQPIAEKRLEVLPWASLCIKDQERLERNQPAGLSAVEE